MPPVMAIKTGRGTHHLSIGLERLSKMHERLTLKVNPDRFNNRFHSVLDSSKTSSFSQHSGHTGRVW
jgi:hypothetical protein